MTPFTVSKARPLLLILCLLCSAVGHSHNSHQVLAEMKKELAQAQKKLIHQKAYVEQLEQEIAHKEIERIQKELEDVNREEMIQQTLSHEQWFSFFDQQREILGQIIRNHPKWRSEALAVLDQILELITELSDAHQ